MLFDRQALFVRERVGFIKLTDTYDLLDLASGAILGQVRDEPTPLFKFLRLLVNKAFLPTQYNVYEGSSAQPCLTVVKRAQFLRAQLEVKIQAHTLLKLRGRLLSLRSYYDVIDPVSGLPAALVQGDWKGWNFQILMPDGREVGTITKKWAGLGKELFTTADNYAVVLGPGAGGFPKAMESLLAISIALDAVHKEKS